MSVAEDSTIPEYILGVTNITLDFLETLAKGIPIPAVRGAIAGVKKVLELVQAVKTNREDVAELESRLLQLALVIANASKPPPIPPTSPTTSSYPPYQLKVFIKKLDSIARDLKRLRATTNAKGICKFFRALLFSSDTARIIKQCTAKLDSEMRLFEVGLKINDALRLEDVKHGVLSIHSTLTRIQDGVQTLIDTSQLAKLPHAPLASYDAFDSNRPDPLRGCLSGTRMSVLQNIRSWIGRIDKDVPFIYWLNGMAGTGKSTIAHSIALMAREAGVLGGSFFFSKHSDATLSDPTLVFSTIAYQLAQFDTSQEFKNRIVAAVLEDPSLLNATAPGKQFSWLIQEPLRQAVGHRDHVVLVVLDALDECQTRGAEAILRALVTAASTNPFPFRFKFFITSRPEAHIMSLLKPSRELTSVLLHDIEPSIVSADIRLYLKHELAEVWRKFGVARGLPEDWVSLQELDALVSLSGELFLFAATSIRIIGDEYERDPRRQLLAILQSSTLSGAPSFNRIDKLYAEVLKNSVPTSFDLGNSAPLFFNRFRDVISMVILLQQPLPISAMDRLAGRAFGDVRAALTHLNSVVFAPSLDAPPQIHHPSFPDFISDEERCIRAGIDKEFVINVQDYHGKLAQWCFTLLGSILADRILGELDPELPNSSIKDLEATLNKLLHPEGRYAMRNWASHLSKAAHGDKELMVAFGSFASTNVLRWLEAMSLLGDISGASRSLLSAREWAPTSSLVFFLMDDTYQLLLSCSQLVTTSAGHLYRSAIPFIPRGTQLFKVFEMDVKRHVDVILGCEEYWPSQSTTLRGHPEEVVAISFSPDGRQLAVACAWTETAAIWDIASGSMVHQLIGHTDDVTSVSFSPDNKRVASGSEDEVVIIWDVATGSIIHQLTGHTDQVRSVSFSPDNQHVASGSEDETVIIWDADSASMIHQLGGHTDVVSSVSYSPDGKQIASGSEDKSVIIWDITSESIIRRLTGHTGRVTSVSFAADGKQLASGSEDETVIVWDVDSGSIIHTLTGHTFDVTSVSFSPDGIHVASGSEDNAVIVWDVTSGSIVHRLTGHTEEVKTVSFSGDGRHLASGSADETAIVWNIKFGPTSQLIGHTDEVNSVSFSPDGRHVASSSDDKTVIVWDTASGSIVHQLVGHSGVVSPVSFSPDSMQIASGSEDMSVIIWDVTSGSIIHRLIGHTRLVPCVSFSPDGELLATGSGDNTVIVWGTTSGSIIHQLTGHTAVVSSVSFSPDSKQLVSGSENAIIVWDAASGSIVLQLADHPEGIVQSVLFSQDGKQVILRSYPDLVFAWNVVTGERMPLLASDRNIVLSSDRVAGPISPFHFQVDSQMLYVRYTSEERHLISHLPASFPVDDLAEIVMTSWASCVAWGCEDGRIAIIRVNRVRDDVFSLVVP